MKYDHRSIQKKWDKRWQEQKIYQPDLDNSKRPYYVLYMFPYPSAEGLHVGHAFSGTGADVYSRFMRMKGYDVFQPMGFDAFGIHSENYALKINDHPKNLIERATKHFREQFDSLGFSYDWSHSVNTSSPAYYKWTQWIFIQLFKAGLAEKKKALVNWCPSCKTVLADEQVVAKANSKLQIANRVDEERLRVCERCGTEVEMKELEQWFFKITDYADRLLEGLSRIDWTEKVKVAQRNWIGKKEGIRIRYEVEKVSKVPKVSEGVSVRSTHDTSDTLDISDTSTIEVFTTRPDTNFGATFIALAPEHPFVTSLLNSKYQIVNSKLNEIKEYVERAKNKSDQERMEEGREKTGVFTGLYAINNLTEERMPVWVSDFVLMGFGTGAVVGVPGHDKRDFQFAKKFGLPIKRVVVGKDGDASEINSIEQVQEEEGTMINSNFLNGLEIHQAIKSIMDYVEEKGFGKREVTYHLRDWLISRQRYWGAPIPMIYCQNCAKQGKTYSSSERSESRSKDEEFSTSSNNKMAGWFPVPEEDLPVLLPYIENFRPLGTGTSPLAQDENFVNTKCPNCGGRAKRETDVADTFLDSSWYFLRYPVSDFDSVPFPSKTWSKSQTVSSSPSVSVSSDVRRKTIRASKTLNEDDQLEKAALRTAWLPIPMYIGGAEHSVLHLLYSRFITKVLFDLKFLNFDEPFSKFRAHGLLIKEGSKMSKSRGNVINPDEYVNKYGADTLRCYLMFLGPYEAGGNFRDSGIEGMERFLKRVRRLVENYLVLNHHSRGKSASFSANSKIDKSINKTIKGVEEDVKSLRYNSALAKIMELINDLNESNPIKRDLGDNIDLKYLKTLVLLLAPFAPYLAEELWEMLAEKSSLSVSSSRPVSVSSNVKRKTIRASKTLNLARSSVHLQSWPKYNEASLKEDEVTIAVEINGKLRSTITIDSSQLASNKAVEEKARKDPKISKYIEGKQIKNVVYVAGKIINFVV